MPGGIELLIILVIVLLLFGAGRLPRIMKDMGKGVHAFKDGLKEGEASETSAPPISEKSDSDESAKGKSQKS